ncbi:lasso peptide biosynthesis B2 protein (plasmid) [Streptomyces sp. NBC_00190]|uniref:lasso peptide biosynthesis B2 protein n=1 Tax=unclassified Streptomyces TaxID=2593676 RepID=UPI002E2E56E2|nr:lasso peptide biosynthesis B2 protein [Streptomyces sp. NBC_00190]WSZ45741.1 lasso peptide biosynthesis B2 protein [Streptomyces sp. NBC_00868]
MSVTTALPADRGSFPLRRRLAARTAVGAARLLARLAPHRLERALTRLARGAVPATEAQATRARELVLTSSLRMNGQRSCLPRSVAVALTCRLGGTWPTWCVGTLMIPPFSPHAWVEAEGRLIGEKGDHANWARLISVAAPGPVTGSRAAGSTR